MSRYNQSMQKFPWLRRVMRPTSFHPKGWVSWESAPKLRVASSIYAPHILHCLLTPHLFQSTEECFRFPLSRFAIAINVVSSCRALRQGNGCWYKGSQYSTCSLLGPLRCRQAEFLMVDAKQQLDVLNWLSGRWVTVVLAGQVCIAFVR
jgi:hypothetical protein